MKIFSRISLIIMAIAALQGCGETTFDADNHVDSFIELSESAANEADKQLLYDLWDVYLRGYVDHNGNVVEPDFAKLDGMNAQETLQELKNHIDYVQFEGFEFATVDDNGNYVAPAIYDRGNPSVDIEVYGKNIHLTAKEDKVTISDVVVNRGNCLLKSNKRGRKIPEDEVKKLMAEGSKMNVTRVRNYNNLSGFDYYEYAKPFPATAKFGQKITRTALGNCNIVEVTVVDANGTWTWGFES